jgi:hypothetical protein
MKRKEGRKKENQEKRKKNVRLNYKVAQPSLTSSQNQEGAELTFVLLMEISNFCEVT